MPDVLDAHRGADRDQRGGQHYRHPELVQHGNDECQIYGLFGNAGATSLTTSSLIIFEEPYFPPGGFRVTKTLIDEEGLVDDGTLFYVSYNCGGQYSGVLSLAPGVAQSVVEIPIGTTCTLYESPPELPGGGGGWLTPVWSPGEVEGYGFSVVITADSANNPIEIGLANTATTDIPGPTTGGFSVHKTVTDPDGLVPADTLYTIDFSCTDGIYGQIFLGADQTGTISGLTVGAICVLTEQEPAALDGGQWDVPQWSPGGAEPGGGYSVLITEQSIHKPIAITLTNAVAGPVVEPATGSMTITKAVVDAGGIVPAGTSFAVDYSCGQDRAGTLAMIAGVPQTVPDLPVGTVCSLAERLPAAPSGGRWGTPTWSPGSVSGTLLAVVITEAAAASPILITLTNTAEVLPAPPIAPPTPPTGPLAQTGPTAGLPRAAGWAMLMLLLGTSATALARRGAASRS